MERGEGPAGTEGDSERAGRRRDSAWLSQVSRLLTCNRCSGVAAFSRLPPCSRRSSSIARSVTDIDLGDARRYLPFLNRVSASERSERLSGVVVAGMATAIVGPRVGSLVDRQWLGVTQLLGSRPVSLHEDQSCRWPQSREIRLPFLDPRLMDLLMRAPIPSKLRSGWTSTPFARPWKHCCRTRISWRRIKASRTLKASGSSTNCVRAVQGSVCFGQPDMPGWNRAEQAPVAQIRAVSSPTKCRHDLVPGNLRALSHLSSGCVAMRRGSHELENEEPGIPRLCPCTRTRVAVSSGATVRHARPLPDDRSADPAPAWLSCGELPTHYIRGVLLSLEEAGTF